MRRSCRNRWADSITPDASRSAPPCGAGAARAGPSAADGGDRQARGWARPRSPSVPAWSGGGGREAAPPAVRRRGIVDRRGVARRHAGHARPSQPGDRRCAVVTVARSRPSRQLLHQLGLRSRRERPARSNRRSVKYRRRFRRPSAALAPRQPEPAEERLRGAPSSLTRPAIGSLPASISSVSTLVRGLPEAPVSSTRPVSSNAVAAALASTYSSSGREKISITHHELWASCVLNGLDHRVHGV